MEFAKRWARNPGLLLLISTMFVLLICLATFGAVFQNSNSDTILSIPALWFAGLYLLPLALFLIVGLVWKRLDRIIR